MSKVLILGATGNLAGRIAKELTAEHPNVTLRLTSSRAQGCAALREQYPQTEVMLADWYDLASLSAAMKGIDKVFVVTPDFVTDEKIATPNIIRAIQSAGGISQVVRLIAIPPGLSAASLSPEVLATRCGAALHVVAKPLFDASGLPMTYINAACWIMFNLPWFLADEVKNHRRLAMPASSDAPRLWISEADIAAIAAKILAEDASKHVGQEYLVTGTERLTFREVAALLSEVVGEEIVYVDDDVPLRATMGESFDTLMTYFGHETRDYRDVPVTNTVQRLLKRPQVDLRAYLRANQDLFI